MGTISLATAESVRKRDRQIIEDARDTLETLLEEYGVTDAVDALKTNDYHDRLQTPYGIKTGTAHALIIYFNPEKSAVRDALNEMTEQHERVEKRDDLITDDGRQMRKYVVVGKDYWD